MNSCSVQTCIVHLKRVRWFGVLLQHLLCIWHARHLPKCMSGLLLVPADAFQTVLWHLSWRATWSVLWVYVWKWCGTL